MGQPCVALGKVQQFRTIAPGILSAMGCWQLFAFEVFKEL